MGKVVRKPVRRRTPSSSPQNPALPASFRRRALISKVDPAANRWAPIAETAGATAAGCAALCCCFPCGLLNLLLLVALKLPAGLLRRALRRRQQQQQRRKRWDAGGMRTTTTALWKWKASPFSEDDGDFSFRDGALTTRSSSEESWPGNSPSSEIAELEKEMLARFHCAGFWRSHSQRQ